ncbi:medium chain dehydrogenase/reductase family protein [Streptomyces sp. NPDC088116]|uniref:medium chain dehydrogenase/reductase family protein n=1 Tax=Streptomyces sp. NPDC088116 TaxID=3365825 RepID=UPI0038125F00
MTKPATPAHRHTGTGTGTGTGTEAAQPVIATEVVLPGVVDPAGLRLRHRPLPAPESGQALVRVEATGISFAEQGMRRGRYPGQPAFPFVPGYDLVGTVDAVGDAADMALTGRRVAVATKTGGWTSHALVPVADLVPVPAGLDPAEAETVVVNGITAHQMLHRVARVASGQTILVHGANGGVGTILVQLARHHGVHVIGTAAPRHHSALRDLGVTPLDYHDPDLSTRVGELAPDGVDAVFDHLGLTSARASFHLLSRGGALVVYGTAARLDDTNAMVPMFLGLLARVYAWNLLPNHRSAAFYNFWGGRTIRPRRFRRHQHHDLGVVLDLLASGAITAQIAARFPLTEVGAAMELAESRTVRGKVVLHP